MKSESITGKAAILEPQNETNIWVASVCVRAITEGRNSFVVSTTADKIIDKIVILTTKVFFIKCKS